MTSSATILPAAPAPAALTDLGLAVALEAA